MKDKEQIIKKITCDFLTKKSPKTILTTKQKKALFESLDIVLQYHELVNDLNYARSDGCTDDKTIKETISWEENQYDRIREAEEALVKALKDVRECILDIFSVNSKDKETINKNLECQYS